MKLIKRLVIAAKNEMSGICPDGRFEIIHPEYHSWWHDTAWGDNHTCISGVPSGITMTNLEGSNFLYLDVRLWRKRQVHIPILKAYPTISLLMLRVFD